MPRIAQIQLRRDTAANWTATNPVLANGEVGYETNTGRAKVGDGSTAWTALSYRFETSLTGYAQLASPTFTGTPTAPTATAGNNSTQLATTAYVDTAVSAVAGGMTYQGTWNATTNTPTLPAAAAGNNGFYYVVSVAGSTSQGGITDWEIGDWVVSNGAAWQKVDNTDKVSSVAGKTGAVTLVVADVSGAAPLAAPTFTGIPAAPTATAGTNTTQLATTEFVTNAILDGGSA